LVIKPVNQEQTEMVNMNHRNEANCFICFVIRNMKSLLFSLVSCLLM
jgi:hypothetical protein